MTFPGLPATNGAGVLGGGIRVIIQDLHEHSSSVLAVGRLSAGLVGENRRSAHLFDLRRESRELDSLAARCGAELPVSEIEWLSVGAGMPCEHCLGLSGTTHEQVPSKHQDLGA
jgi:hypothetical protein